MKMDDKASDKELLFYLDKNGVGREYDRSLDLTINFEDRGQMEDFNVWMQRVGAEAFRKWRHGMCTKP